MSINPLELFDPLTANWFKKSLGTPTAVQKEAWPAIAAGEHTLVSAPTGTGKTLSAFLVFIDRLLSEAREGTLKQELKLIYISPLKSLAGDIRENLRKPLNGILEEEYNANPKANSTPFDLNIAIRTGDTPQSERRKMIKTPPHILITTPESLYLMLTSISGQKILKTARHIIIDELHALIDSKRGAHLMLSIARLDKLCLEPLQRIGLSATIEPLSIAADYLCPDSVTIVAPKMHKEIKLIVTSHLSNSETFGRDMFWNEFARTVYEHCEGTYSVIAFVEGRAYAEKLAYYVNLLGGDGFARTHHGSLSKEQRFTVEHDLRDGNLRLLCATSSMELGIDVGEIDMVFQIGCPRSISSTMQRLGRAGHNPGRTSVMHIFPRTEVDGLYSGMTAEVVRNGGIEYSKPPKLCLDVLAQHLVSMATGEGYKLDNVMEILPRAYPFSEVTKEDVRDVLSMLAGDYEHERDIPVRPRILYDRIHERVEGDPYSRMLAISAGGTIPDMGLYAVRNEHGVKIGEVDEEFVFEAHEGDKFMLGSFAWQITNMQKDTIIVKQSSIAGARPPFWKGQMKGRKLQTGLKFGEILRTLSTAYEEGKLFDKLSDLGMDQMSAQGAEDFLKRQIDITGVIPNDRTIIVEHFRDETGAHQMMVHSVFGRQVNEPIAILMQLIAKRKVKTNVSYFCDDDGFLLFPYGECELPEGLLYELPSESAKPLLESLLPASSVFNMAFRYNAGRALMMGVRKKGRQPLWIQRFRSTQMLDYLMRYKNHPLIRETTRECLNDYWDLTGVEYVLDGIRSGNISVREMYIEKPSPMSLPLRHQAEANMLYEYAPTTSGIQASVEESLKQTQMIDPTPEHLAKVSERIRLPQDEKQLHSLLMIEGDLIAGDLDVPIEWLEKLARQNQAKYIEPGLWIAAEHADEYNLALNNSDMDGIMHITRRLLRYRGAFAIQQISDRYLWKDDVVQIALTELCRQESVVESDGLYYHSDIYNRARQEMVKSRRKQIKTQPAERYASLLVNRIHINAPSKEQLEKSITLLCDQSFPPAVWENILLPARVSGFRTDLLDTLLSQGNIFWHINADSELSFHSYEDINWDADMTDILSNLEDEEKIIYDALLKRGASFMQRLSGLLGGASPYNTLLKLAEKGLIYADNFIPVRQWMNKDKIERSTTKQRVNARVKALSAGRWEILRPRKELSIEEQLNRLFDRVIILCRETAQGLPWVSILETLRVWEYTGRVRRGYFIEGLSGIQFIRDEDFTGTMLSLEQPREDIIWLAAVDPAQPWGKILSHRKERSFLNIPGTAVALRAGLPIAVLERQGKVLRVFDNEYISEALQLFAGDFTRRRIFSTLNRITIKQYPPEAADGLKDAGFSKEIQDYVLYRR